MPVLPQLNRRNLMVVGGAIGALSLAACSSAASPAPSTLAASSAAAASVPSSSECAAAAAASGAQTAATADYYMVFNVGMPEKMYSNSQMNSMHPTSGELMLAGTMMGATATATKSADSGSMPGMGETAQPTASSRHVEVQICDKQSGKVMTTAMPTIAMGAMGASLASMPVSRMQGVDKEASDIHYGNNLPMTPGTQYTVKVTINGQSTTYTATAPA
jgi:hypothetical protein